MKTPRRKATPVEIASLLMDAVCTRAEREQAALAELVGEIGGTLLLLSYSRDMERQADAFGRDLLRRAGLSSHAMARFFARLGGTKKAAGTNALTGYFSSHPPLAERIAATDKDEGGQPALDARAWRALQTICD